MRLLGLEISRAPALIEKAPADLAMLSDNVARPRMDDDL